MKRGTASILRSQQTPSKPNNRQMRNAGRKKAFTTGAGEKCGSNLFSQVMMTGTSLTPHLVQMSLFCDGGSERCSPSRFLSSEIKQVVRSGMRLSPTNRMAKECFFGISTLF